MQFVSHLLEAPLLLLHLASLGSLQALRSHQLSSTVHSRQNGPSGGINTAQLSAVQAATADALWHGLLAL
jgi:hypothetical protein